MISVEPRRDCTRGGGSRWGMPTKMQPERSQIEAGAASCCASLWLSRSYGAVFKSGGGPALLETTAGLPRAPRDRPNDDVH